MQIQFVDKDDLPPANVVQHRESHEDLDEDVGFGKR